MSGFREPEATAIDGHEEGPGERVAMGAEGEETLDLVGTEDPGRLGVTRGPFDAGQEGFDLTAGIDGWAFVEPGQLDDPFRIGLDRARSQLPKDEERDEFLSGYRCTFHTPGACACGSTSSSLRRSPPRSGFVQHAGGDEPPFHAGLDPDAWRALHRPCRRRSLAFGEHARLVAFCHPLSVIWFRRA
jgi:hypothetical protein